MATAAKIRQVEMIAAEAAATTASRITRQGWRRATWEGEGKHRNDLEEDESLKPQRPPGVRRQAEQLVK